MTALSYRDAANRLGIPDEDLTGFADFVCSFPTHKPDAIAPDLFKHISEDYRADGEYHGSELERRVLESRLGERLPLPEALGVAKRLEAGFSGYNYGLLADVLRAQLNRPSERIVGEQLAMIMGVPAEDRSAFFELLYDWLDDDEDWQEQVSGRGYCVESEPIPRTSLRAFWEQFPSSEPYSGSALENGVLAERALLVRSIEEVKQVLARTFAHVIASPDRPAFELRGVLVGLQEGLCTYAFEDVAAEQPLKVVA